MSPALDRPDRHLAGQPGVRRTSPAGSSTCPAATLAVAEGWHRGPTVDGPPTTRPSIGPLVEPSSWPRPAPTPTCSATTRSEEERRCPSTPMPSAPSASPASRRWTSKDALLYALGVGAGADELAFTTENTIDVAAAGAAHHGAWCSAPSAAGVVGSHRHVQPRPCSCTASRAIALHRRDPGRGRRSPASTEITGIYDKGKGAVVVIETPTRPTSPPASRCSPR